jgi:hypothetical protein
MKLMSGFQISVGNIRLGFIIESRVLNELYTLGLDRDLILMLVRNVGFV